MILNLKNYLFLALLLIAEFPRPAAGQVPIIRIQLSNTTERNRPEEVVEIPLKNLPAFNKSVRIINSADKRELLSQIEYAGFEKPVNLLVLVPPLSPGKSIVLEIVSGGPSKVNSKTFGRFVPERKDDFAWENDLVAFRMYGKALEKERDNAYGTDIWSKRTTDLIIDKWYKGNDYHTDHGEGMDYYSVGLTLGAGDIAPWDGDSIRFSKNYHHYKILDNGPIRTSFQLGYDDWKVGKRTMRATKTISIDAGSQMNRVTAVYDVSDSSEIGLVIGIAKRSQPGSIYLDEAKGILGYWEPEVSGKGIMGIGILVPQTKQMKIYQGHLMNITASRPGQPVTYYNGGAWDKAGRIQNAMEWFTYLENFKFQKEHPLKIIIL